MTQPETSSLKPPVSSLGGRKRAPTKTTWRKGTSGNPAGRPSAGQSWAEVWRTVTDKTPDELAAEVGGPSSELGRALAALPQSVAMKHLMAIRVLLAIMTEPSASLLNAVVNSEAVAALEDRIHALESSVAETKAREAHRQSAP